MSLEGNGKGFEFLRRKTLQTVLHKNKHTGGCAASHSAKQKKTCNLLHVPRGISLNT